MNITGYPVHTTASTHFADAFEVTTYDYNNYDDGVCKYNAHGASFLPVLYSLFFILGFLGNVLVLWVILLRVRLRSMTDVCLLNLALADLLLVCSLPFLAHHARHQWVFGDVMCKVVLSAYHVGFYSGIFFITLMSVDRYLAIVHAVYAMRARTRKYGAIAAVVTWLAGFLASFPEALFLKVEKNNEKENCRPVYDGHSWGIFALFKRIIFGLLIPLIIMGFCYTQIVRRLLSAPSSKKQAIRLILIVVVVFFCCWTPYNMTSFFKALELSEVYSSCESSKAIRLTLQITEAMAYSHSCLNPILYVFVGQKFRRPLIRLINKAPCRMCQFMKNYLPRDFRVSRTGSIYSQTTSMDERSTAVGTAT
ncbi:C-C chemokine receptor type 5-like [Salmo salar]|uniref:C-C chemokine receptor type 5-like n=1 Tax=Salmo salar TaxID=8030 RepID=A0A1S3NJK5_SALSA|nr:C-C chemokine receptor type 5-like [Salmo salar]|eukprot:XP_014015604.1 PREDICTED: C-C chemokine receptor type 5-like [Salmo salar]